MMTEQKESSEDMLKFFGAVLKTAFLALASITVIYFLPVGTISSSVKDDERQEVANKASLKENKSSSTQEMMSLFSDGGAVFNDMSLSNGIEQRKLGFGEVSK